MTNLITPFRKNFNTNFCTYFIVLILLKILKGEVFFSIEGQKYLKVEFFIFKLLKKALILLLIFNKKENKKRKKTAC